MNANTIGPVNAQTAARFDAKFIEDHKLLDRYLEGKLPAKGARDLENWCRANPAYLEALNLSQRTEPKPPWWKSPYVPIAGGVVAFVCLLGFWALFGKYMLLRQELEDTRTRMRQGSLVQPAVETNLHVVPDRAPGIDKARITVNRGQPQLIDLHIDLGYSKQLQQYRMFVDKQDQGRALILNDLLKDSNGELRLTFNTTGLAAGVYSIRIESLPVHASGSPTPEGWLILDVR
jgi:hypothetical protein